MKCGNRPPTAAAASRLVPNHLAAAATAFTIVATARHFIRIAGSRANFAGIFPLCFTKSMNVSAKASGVAEDVPPLGLEIEKSQFRARISIDINAVFR